MTLLNERPRDIVEAVIISGPHKGQIVPWETDGTFGPQEQQMLGAIASAFREIARNSGSAVREAQALVRELRDGCQE